MSEALTIDFALTGVSAVAGGFSQIAAVSGRAHARIRALSKSVKVAVSDLKALNAQLLRYNRLAGSASRPSLPAARPAGPGVGSNPGGGSPGTAPKPSGRRFVSGPFQREASLRQNITDAQAAGNNRALADAHLAYTANQKKIDKVMNPPKPKGLGERALDVLKTSRFSEEGKIMPLVGKTLGLITEALGPELSAVAGPAGLLAAAAVQGAKALRELAVNAAASGVAFNDRANALGNSGGTGAAVGLLAGVDGVGQASAYNSAITGGGLGTYAGYREGQHNLGNPLVSNLDKGQQYWDAMTARRKMSHDDQLRQAEMTGTMGSMPLMALSDKQFNIVHDQGVAQSKIMDGTAGPSVDFQQSEAGLKAATDNLAAALGAPLLKPLADFENGLAGATNGVAKWFTTTAGKATGSLLTTIASGLVGAISTAGAGEGGGVAAPLDGKGALAANTDATNKNTDAARALARAMPGTFGAQDSSGRRAGAFPSEVGPNNIMARNDAIRTKMVYSAF